MLFLLFQLGADRYALPACDVAEVLPLVALKEIPTAPRGVAGLIDYRGAAVPAIDLSALALGRAAARRVSTRVFMVNYPLGTKGGGTRLLGLIAEHATEMTNKAAGDFQFTGVRTTGARYLGPVATDPRGMIQRVEVSELLDEALRAALFPEDSAGAPPVDVSDAGSRPAVP
jgi:chemotaxis-related protein WspB